LRFMISVSGDYRSRVSARNGSPDRPRPRSANSTRTRCAARCPVGGTGVVHPLRAAGGVGLRRVPMGSPMAGGGWCLADFRMAVRPWRAFATKIVNRATEPRYLPIVSRLLFSLTLCAPAAVSRSGNRTPAAALRRGSCNAPATTSMLTWHTILRSQRSRMSADCRAAILRGRSNDRREFRLTSG
jgi:hypothetical protein